MLFSSYLFILVFLPAALAGYALAGRAGARAGIAWLVLASLAFYGWWSLGDLALIALLTLFNYGCGLWQNRSWERNGHGDRAALALGLAADLAVLGYFKYTDLALITANALAGTAIPLQHIVLPLGISFYTFQKVAFLVDAWQGRTRGVSFLDYCLFVTFFPQLIAGPIVHHHDVFGQFKAMTGRLRADDLAVGATLFAVGLFKKAVIADRLAPTADAVFAAAEGRPLGCGEAWTGVLAYAGQLYFDFSGYSDMAIGLGRMFSVRLPMNFDSPFQAGDIIGFWQRWHMTLSRFLRDYLYFPMLGRSRSFARHQASVIATMLLGGLWHGAGWTFVAWGAMQGLFLAANHQWRQVRRRLGWTEPGRAARLAGWAATFAATLAGFAVFRAASFAGAGSMLRGMAGLSPAGNPGPPLFKPADLALIAAALAIALLMPSIARIMRDAEPVLDHRSLEPCRLRWAPDWRWGLATGVLALLALQSLNRPSPFLYFQF